MSETSAVPGPGEESWRLGLGLGWPQVDWPGPAPRGWHVQARRRRFSLEVFLQPCKEVGAGCTESAPPDWPACWVIDRAPYSTPAALLTLMSKFFPPLSRLEVLTDQGNKFQLQSLICVRRVFFTPVSPLWRISWGRSWKSRKRWKGWERRSASVRARTRDRGEETWRARRWFLGSQHQRERGNAKFVFARGGKGGSSRPAGGLHRRSNFGGGRRASARVCPCECIWARGERAPGGGDGREAEGLAVQHVKP